MGGLPALASLLLCAPSFAQDRPGFDLHWDAPPDCPGATQVRARLTEILGPKAELLDQVQLQVEAHVEHPSDRFRLTLNIRSGQSAGTRVIEAASCQNLAGAAAVTLALLVRGEDRLAPPPPDTRPPAGPLPALPSVPPLPPVPPTAATAPSGLRFLLAASPIIGDIGVLPQPDYGLGLSAGFRYQRVRVIAGATFWLPQSTSSSAYPGYGATFTRRTGELSGCAGWRAGEFEIAPCAVVTLENVTAQGTGTDVIASSGQNTWLSLGGGLLGAWHLSEWAAVFLDVTGRAATSRARFVIQGLGGVYQVAPVAASAVVGCELIF